MSSSPIGRGASSNPGNRFERLHVGPPPEGLEQFFEDPEPDRREPTQFLRDASRSVLAKNDSPDVGFTYSINPYRGCEHGCVYCYARPSHEYLGFSSGVDFESRILVKQDAPDLLAQAFRRKSWVSQPVALSGNTDCYQPVERQLGITRRCLEVFLRHRNPVTIVTKNALVLRDLDILTELARLGLVRVHVSVTTLRQEVARVMEPRTSAVRRRLETIAALSGAGVPAGVMVAPVIPGLTDEEIPAIVSAAASHGAVQAGYILLRLPYAVRELFTEWVGKHFPERASRIVGRIRQMRDGALSDPGFGTRMTGTGEVADAIRALFDVSCRRAGLDTRLPELATHRFRRDPSDQASLFPEPGDDE